MRHRIDYNGTAFVHFNSRTHVECDVHRIHFFPPIVRISTHALTWSATVCAKSKDLPRIISTHALTWSATELLSHTYHIQHISTHALTWSATFRIQFQMFSDWISTHALTWSATLPFASFCAIMGISTHALTWSATIAQSLAQRPAVFQLTHSRGVRPAGCTDNGK